MRIEPLTPAYADDPATMTELGDLINAAYKVAEDGMWRDGTARTNPAELAGYTRAGELVVARLDGRLAGCVRVRELDGELSEFGMLVTAPEHRGAGTGGALIRFAEERSLAAGRPVMQLELLVPREWSHPFKEYLTGWYGRIGYRLVRVGTIDEAHPALAPQLATPCDFRTYRKDLRVHAE
jgi:GNAT superfamily N-acetyltransferase